MTKDEFFELCIWDAVGFPKKDSKDMVYLKMEEKPVWIATLEIQKESKFLWVSWPKVYFPLILNFKMTEIEVTEFIRTKLDVNFVGFYPSVARFQMYGMPTDRLTADTVEELESIRKNLNQF